jgi:EmrB/QacA subfamily drug resistance transporter
MSAAAATPSPVRTLDPARFRLVLIALLLGLLLAALDQTIVSTALPTITGELGGLNHVSWVVTAYLLTSTIAALLYGKLGDLFGRKLIFQVAIVIFLIGSALCGLAQNMNELILFRALQGLGGGGLIVTSQAIIADVVSPRERGRYSGLFGGVFGLASVAGPLLGGFLVDSISWRWVFYVNLPVGALALVMTSVALTVPPERGRAQIDWLGAALLAIGVSSLVLGLSWGGTTHPWGSATIVGLFAVSVVVLGVFLLAERRAPEPIVPLSLFANRVFARTSAIGFIVGFALFGSVIFLPQYLQIVRGSNPTVSGLELLPLMAGLLVTSIGSGALVTRFGRYKVFPIVGTAVMAVGMFLLSRLGVDTAMGLVYGAMLVLGLGLGCVLQVLVIAVQNSVSPRDIGVATSGATFFRSIGGSVGTAVFGTIFANRLATELAGLASAGGQGLSADGGTARLSAEAIHALPPSVRAGYLSAYADALHPVFLAAVPLCLIAFAIAWIVPEVTLRTETVTASVQHVGEGFGMDGAVGASLVQEAEARTRAAQAALDRLDAVAAEEHLDPELAARVRGHYEERLARMHEHEALLARVAGDPELPPAFWAVVHDLVGTERAELERLRTDEELQDAVARRLSRDLEDDAACLERGEPAPA